MEAVERTSGLPGLPAALWAEPRRRGGSLSCRVRLIVCAAAALLAGHGCGDDGAELNRLALSRMEAGELGEAQELLRVAAMSAPDEPALYANLAEVSVRRGEYDYAARQQARAVELERGEDPAQRRRLGEILLLAGRPAEAVTELEAALERSPQDAGLAYALGVALFQAGERTRLRSHLDDCLVRFPGDPGFRTLESLLALVRGDTAAARDLLDPVLTENPEFVPAHLVMGDLALREGDLELAVGSYEKAMAESPDPSLSLKLGKASARLGRPEPAERYLQAAARGDHQSEALLELAALYARNPGEHWRPGEASTKALECLDRILVADPLDLRARNLKAAVYARRRQLDLMLNEYTKSLSIDPNQPEVRAVVKTYQAAGAENRGASAP